LASFNSNTSNTYKLILEITQSSQSIKDNSSTLSWTLKMNNNGMKYQNQNTKDTFKVVINGTTVYNTSRAIWFDSNYSTITVASGSLTVKHNDDGKKSVSASFSYSPGKTASYYPSSMSGTGTMTLTTIPRQATLTEAPNFTDEENPTIKYSNSAGEAVTSLKACIADANGQNLYAEYRDISKTGSSYTFNLTDAERNKLIYAAINSPNLTVKFYVTTVIGGVTYYSTLDKIMTVVNAHPVISPTIKDMGGTSVALTGDGENKIIKGFNYIQASVNATAKKGSSIKSQSITCGGQTINAASGNFQNIESATFVITATDSRGYTTTQTIEKTLINYLKPTCNLKANNPTADGKMSLKISGNYFNGNFGAVDNTLSVTYRYKENNGEYSDWIAATATKSGNTYEATVNLTGLDYRNAYTFQARAMDKINNAVSIEKKVKSIPVFDWGENDFNINGDLTIKGTNLIDLIYPVGSIYMSVNYFDPATIFGGKWERLMDKFLLGSGAIYASGQEGGEATHTLTTEEIPSHNHTVYNTNGSGDTLTTMTVSAGGNKGYGWNIMTSNSGGGKAHNNMPPYLVVNMWKRVE
jgi:hypothetical protein